MLNTILFSGEIFQIMFHMTKLGYSKLDFTTIKTIFIAPFLEEFIYRSCLINIFIEAGVYSPTKCVLILPCFFAISHLHHVFQQQRRQRQLKKWHMQEHPEQPLPDEQWISCRKALLIALFKLSYTQVFGLYSGFVYIKTGSLWPAIALHCQCNFFGFPSFDNLMNKDQKNTYRIAALVLYIAGTIIFFKSFDWFFLNCGTPWWDMPQVLIDNSPTVQDVVQDL